jgi:hypothetical protein
MAMTLFAPPWTVMEKAEEWRMSKRALAKIRDFLSKPFLPEF